MQLSECAQAWTHKQITQKLFNIINSSIWCCWVEGNVTKTLSRTFGGSSEMFHPLLPQAAAFGLSRRGSEKHPYRAPRPTRGRPPLSPDWTGTKRKHVPAEVCLNFSVFFFLHFQGFRRRPRVANLLRRRLGGVWPPGMTDSERMADSLSTSSAARREKKKKLV